MTQTSNNNSNKKEKNSIVTTLVGQIAQSKANQTKTSHTKKEQKNDSEWEYKPSETLSTYKIRKAVLLPSSLTAKNSLKNYSNEA